MGKKSGLGRYRRRTVYSRKRKKGPFSGSENGRSNVRVEKWEGKSLERHSKKKERHGQSRRGVGGKNRCFVSLPEKGCGKEGTSGRECSGGSSNAISVPWGIL